MFKRHVNNGIIYFTSPVLDSFGVPHFFASRFGGVSSGAFDSLNVSPARKDRDGNTDTSENICENYRRALAVIGSEPEHSVTTKQVHSCIIRKALPSDAGLGILPSLKVKDDCDGIFLENGTGNIDTVCAKTADCVPILLADAKTGNVCSVHAGWRGTAGGIILNAAKCMNADPSFLLCAVGPCIGSCCYEVGDDVYSSVGQIFRQCGIEEKTDRMFSIEVMCSISGKRYADLARINKTLLMTLGVPEENIDLSGLCTCCSRENDGQPTFFSHRGTGGFSGTFVSAAKTFKPKISE